MEYCREIWRIMHQIELDDIKLVLHSQIEEEIDKCIKSNWTISRWFCDAKSKKNLTKQETPSATRQNATLYKQRHKPVLYSREHHFLDVESDLQEDLSTNLPAHAMLQC